MNDLTKEELQEINRCLKYMIKGGVTPYSSLTMAVKKRVQAMIDNYCQHDKDILPVYTMSGDMPCAAFCYECNSSVDKSFIDE